MTWYKAFERDLTCLGMKYEIDKEHKIDESPILYERGFHYCKEVRDCYMVYPMTGDTRICEVEPLGEVVVDEDGVIFCTNHIKIVREIENPREMSNVNKSSSGFFNSGRYNSGNLNSGSYNSGNLNSGSYNSGDYNTGSYNSGRHNSGYYNSGNFSSGVFNTAINPKIRIFDKESNWTIADWYSSRAFEVICSCPNITTSFVYESDMSDEEKFNHPEYTTIGGYVKKVIVTKEDKQKWWDNLSDKDKQAIYDLPNFDADKFEKCTEIKVNSEVKE